MDWSESVEARNMLRYLAEHADRRVLALVCADVAETALPFCDDDMITAAVWAVSATRRWACGEADLGEVQASWDAVDGAGETYNFTTGAVVDAARSLATVVFDQEAAGPTATEAAASAAWALETDDVKQWDWTLRRRLTSLAVYIRLRLPYDPATTRYALWRGMLVCPEMIREQKLCPTASVQWDADCEAGKAPVFA